MLFYFRLKPRKQRPVLMRLPQLVRLKNNIKNDIIFVILSCGIAAMSIGYFLAFIQNTSFDQAVKSAASYVDSGIARRGKNVGQYLYRMPGKMSKAVTGLLPQGSLSVQL